MVGAGLKDFEAGQSRSSIESATARQQLQQLENEETEAFTELGKRVGIIEGVVRDANNIHKTIRDAITEAVIFYQQMQDYRPALTKAREAQTQDLKRAIAEACQEGNGRVVPQTHPGCSGQANAKLTEGKPASQTLSKGGNRRYAPGKPTVLSKGVGIGVERKKREASSPPQTFTPGKKSRQGRDHDVDMEATNTPQHRNLPEDRDSRSIVWEKVERKKQQKPKTENTKKSLGKGLRGRLLEAVAAKS